MATNDADTNDTKVREVLAVAKELHAAQQQSMRLMARYKTLLGKVPGELWTSPGCLTVVDANRAVWRLVWNGGYPSVERVATVDIADEPLPSPLREWEANEKPAAASTPSLPMVVYTEATEGRPVTADDDAPAMWKEALDL